MSTRERERERESGPWGALLSQETVLRGRRRRGRGTHVDNVLERGLHREVCLVRLHRLFNNVEDAPEADLAFAEHLVRLFVGAVEGGGHGAACDVKTGAENLFVIHIYILFAHTHTYIYVYIYIYIYIYIRICIYAYMYIYM